VNLRPATWFDRFLDCNGQTKKANRLNPSRVKRPGFLHSSLLLTSRFFELLLCDADHQSLPLDLRSTRRNRT